LIEEFIMRILGWCPGTDAAMEFNKRRGTEKVAGLLAFLGVWLIGYGWVTSVAQGLYGMEKMLFTNRTTFLLLLGGIFIIGYTWKQFKPSEWELPEFNYNRLSIDDLPDIPIDAGYTWFGGPSNPSMGPGNRADGRGFEKAGTLRDTDIEWYRSKIEYYKKQRDERAKQQGIELPKRNVEKIPLIRIFSVLALILTGTVSYSYFVFKPEQTAIEAYAFERLSGFEIMVTKPYTEDQGRTGVTVVWLYDFDEFVSLAKSQNAEMIYYDTEHKGGNYFSFNSPIYEEEYAIHLSDIPARPG